MFPTDWDYALDYRSRSRRRSVAFIFKDALRAFGQIRFAGEQGNGAAGAGRLKIVSDRSPEHRAARCPWNFTLSFLHLQPVRAWDEMHAAIQNRDWLESDPDADTAVILPRSQ